MNKTEKQILAQDTRSWDGAALPSYPSGTPEIVICRIKIAPGARLDKHYHPVINAGIVERGILTIVADDGRERDFGPGEAIIEMVNVAHYGENRGDEPVDLVMFYASTPGTPISLSSE